MKLIVNKLPDTSNECLFHEKSFKIKKKPDGEYEKKKCNYCSLSNHAKQKRNECSLDLDKKCRYLIELYR